MGALSCRVYALVRVRMKSQRERIVVVWRCIILIARDSGQYMESVEVV